MENKKFVSRNTLNGITLTIWNEGGLSLSKFNGKEWKDLGINKYQPQAIVDLLRIAKLAK